MSLDMDRIMGSCGPSFQIFLHQSKAYLDSQNRQELLANLGRIVVKPGSFSPVDKRWFQCSYQDAKSEPNHDFLVGKDLFFINEEGRLMLDGLAGHYQMNWGFRHPELEAALQEGIARGIAWDVNLTIPGPIVKRLSERLVFVCCNLSQPEQLPSNDADVLNTVLLALCTGSAAVAAGMKIVLLHYEAVKGLSEPPVFVTINGNYHGTDMATQRLRGMWKSYIPNIHSVTIEPNDENALQESFEQYGERVAGFFCEPILMNREAITIHAEFMQLARALCDRYGALFLLDEIQTGYFVHEIFSFHRYGIIPDLIATGKGLTAGFHPMSGIIYKRKLDRLAQYDAINTNGAAPLPSWMALCNLELIHQERDRISTIERYAEAAGKELASRYPQLLATVNGFGLMTGLKFHRRCDAVEFHRLCLKSGIWNKIHVHAKGYTSVVSKFALPVDEAIIDHTIEIYERHLKKLGA